MRKIVVILSIIVLGIAFLVIPGSAQTEGCHGDILSDECQCNACSVALNLQVIPTCDGLQLTWNDIGADSYMIVYFYPPNNAWVPVPMLISGTSFLISNDDLQPGTYSFAVFPYNSQSGFVCYSNIVCDVELPTTCPNIPEFPSIFLPATMIIGLLGAVLLIQRTREH
jgi:hypothetical protein